MLKSILIFAHFIFCYPLFAQVLPKHIIEQRKTLVENDKRSRAILANLYEINKTIKKVVLEKSTIEQQKNLLEIQASTLTEQIKTLEGTVLKYKLSLSTRLRDSYKLNEDGLVKLFRQSTNPALYEKNLKILSAVARRDHELAKEYLLSKKHLDSERRKLIAKIDSIKQIQFDLLAKESQLLKNQEEKNTVLKQIQKNQNFTVQKLSELKAKSKIVSDSGVLDPLLKDSILEYKGKLSPPVASPVAISFGIKKVDKYLVNNKGVFFSSSSGSPVHTVFSGTVAFSGFLPGFGNTIIIDHGDHYYSVYAYLNQILVQSSETINANQKIAFSGRSDLHEQDGLYFEIRHFSEPTNPISWFKGS